MAVTAVIFNINGNDEILTTHIFGLLLSDPGYDLRSNRLPLARSLLKHSATCNKVDITTLSSDTRHFAFLVVDGHETERRKGFEKPRVILHKQYHV